MTRYNDNTKTRRAFALADSPASSRLAGTPDIVLPKHRKVIFVHGCFWHKHRCRYGRVKPATRVDFWEKKRQGNVDRDRRQQRELRRAGWKVLVVWECQTRTDGIERLTKRLLDFLNR